MTRVAVVGAGAWGEQHARVFAGRADTELVAVLGRNPEKTSARAARYGATAYTDLDRMLAAEHPDLVAVCLPNEQHFATTLRLIEAEVPLLVEKPLVFDLGEADVLLAAAAERDLFFALNFNHRFAEPVQRARAAIEAGELGETVFATWRFGGEGSVGGTPHANLIETQCHGFDLLEHLVGPIVSVATQMTATTGTVALALEFATGAVGTMVGSYESSYAYPDSQLIEINGTAGRAVIRDTVRQLELSRVGDAATEIWQAGYFDDESRSFAGTVDRHVDALLLALRSGSEPPVHARAGRRALELAMAAIRSHERGERVRVGPGSGALG